MEPGKLVITIIVFILLIVALYYLSQLLFNTDGIQDLVIQAQSSGGIKAATPSGSPSPYKYSGPTMVPQIYPGGEYSISTWIYVQNWVSTVSAKPFLSLSGGGTTQLTLLMYLGQSVNKLGIQVASSSTDLTLVSPAILPAAVTAGSGIYSDASGNALDINSIDLQRWLNITVVMSGRNVDIYMDGKLTRSSLLAAPFVVEGSTPTIVLGDPLSFKGLIGMTRAANFAYTPDKVYTYYQEGPFSGFSLGTLNPFQYSIVVKNNAGVIFST
jgi:hypothetical protein